MENKTLAQQTLVLESNYYLHTKALLEEIPSVVSAIWTDLTSSSGNWSGLIVEKVGEKYQVYDFSQEVDFGTGNATIYIGDPVLILNTLLPDDTIVELLEARDDFGFFGEYLEDEEETPSQNANCVQRQIDFEG
jgi:hypothetical protein